MDFGGLLSVCRWRYRLDLLRLVRLQLLAYC
jgi:hypothetical protein